MLRRASISSRGNSTPAIADCRVHRQAEVRGPGGRVDLPSPARAGLPGPTATGRAPIARSRLLHLQGGRRCKGVRTTTPGKDGHRAGDLLDRDFTAVVPNRTWVMDFTYARTWCDDQSRWSQIV